MAEIRISQLPELLDALKPDATFAATQDGMTQGVLASQIVDLALSGIAVTENSNGVAIRFPGGIQLCAFRLALPALGAGVQSTYTWTYPQEFIEDPVVLALTGTGSANAYRRVGYNHNAAGTATAEFVVADTRSSGGTVGLSISMFAFGKY